MGLLSRQAGRKGKPCDGTQPSVTERTVLAGLPWAALPAVVLLCLPGSWGRGTKTPEPVPPAHLSEGSGSKVTDASPHVPGAFQGGPACDQLPAGLGRVTVALWREVGGASGSTPEHLPTWGLGRDLEQGKAPS